MYVWCVRVVCMCACGVCFVCDVSGCDVWRYACWRGTPSPEGWPGYLSLMPNRYMHLFVCVCVCVRACDSISLCSAADRHDHRHVGAGVERPRNALRVRREGWRVQHYPIRGERVGEYSSIRGERVGEYSALQSEVRGLESTAVSEVRGLESKLYQR